MDPWKGNPGNKLLNPLTFQMSPLKICRLFELFELLELFMLFKLLELFILRPHRFSNSNWLVLTVARYYLECLQHLHHLVTAAEGSMKRTKDKMYV
jgi:hypothetical protein